MMWVVVVVGIGLGMVLGILGERRASRLARPSPEAPRPLRAADRVYCVDCRFFRWDTGDDLQCVAVLDRGKPTRCGANAYHGCPHWQADEEDEEDKNVE